jgi:hypothetical protein
MGESPSWLVCVVEGNKLRDSQAAANTAGSAAGSYGSTAGGIGANVIPFETRQLTNPTGLSQRDIGARITQGLAGTGGATAGLTGAAGKMGMDTRNPVGFSGALDAAAMQRDKGNAMVGEKIAGDNSEVKLNQQSQAASNLGKLYGMSSEAQTGEAGVQAKDLQTANEMPPWLTAALSLGKDATSVFSTLNKSGGGGNNS